MSGLCSHQKLSANLNFYAVSGVRMAVSSCYNITVSDKWSVLVSLDVTING